MEAVAIQENSLKLREMVGMDEVVQVAAIETLFESWLETNYTSHY